MGEANRRMVDELRSNMNQQNQQMKKAVKKIEEMGNEVKKTAEDKLSLATVERSERLKEMNSRFERLQQWQMEMERRYLSRCDREPPQKE